MTGIRYEYILVKFVIIVTVITTLLSCGEEPIEETNTLFSKISAKTSGVEFVNQLHFNKKFNIYTYRNFYNGGGVAIGDINNDGWQDIYFTSNMEENKLYLNKGADASSTSGFEFEDITTFAGVAGQKQWSTGVSMVDINADGLVDIYVCNSGDIEGDNKQNELFINQGDNTFTEEAEKYGLADSGYSTHATFFDYDRDGDLDCYLLNNSFQAIGSFNLRKNERPNRHPTGGDKLFRNDNGQYVDVSEEAGIYGSIIGFGLGVTAGDLDQDGWTDLYISNDFFERDYIYMNNGDGTFKENLEEQMNSISGASMGADAADINNDGYLDVFVTEMLPHTNDRLKTKTTFENWDRYQYALSNGYYHQFTRNMFHLNNGNNTFSEIGRMLGVEATDWSWGALIADFDNDGHKDLFVANGINRDLTDQDYINFISTPEMAKKVITSEGVNFEELVNVIPSNRIPNFMFKNDQNYTFTDVSAEWGLDEKSHSNGSAYGDFDNDGDLDLVISNVNMKASLYKNNAIEKQGLKSNYIKLNLKGQGQNTMGIGAKASLHIGDQILYQEKIVSRGFQSSMDPILNFGLGEVTVVDSIVIVWADGSTTKNLNVDANQMITFSQESADGNANIKREISGPFNDITASINNTPSHIENEFIDFDRERLIYHMLSSDGPAMDMSDVNGDGLDDIYLGGSKGYSGQLLIQTRNGNYLKSNQALFEKDKDAEDTDAAFLDMDGDGDMDLYVASGGGEYPNSSALLNDRIYINDGSGQYKRTNQPLPSFRFENTSSVSYADYDGDGDNDLFIGVRSIPFQIGVPCSGYILENDGRAKYKNVTKSVAPELQNLGMITDGIWSDIDRDGDQDLIVVGHYMKVEIFENREGKLTRANKGVNETLGWWNTIAAADVDNDGDTDYIVGNHGLNTRFKVTDDAPVEMHVNDFDNNRSVECIISTYENGELYPLALRHDLVMQLPHLKKKYLKYEDYKAVTMSDLFSPEEYANTLVNKANYLESAVLINNGSDPWTFEQLPKLAQFSPVFSITPVDVDGDGVEDLVVGGNFYRAKPEVGRYDASYGLYLKGKGDGTFTAVSSKESGLLMKGEVRELKVITKPNGKRLLAVAKNNDNMQFFEF